MFGKTSCFTAVYIKVVKAKLFINKLFTHKHAILIVTSQDFLYNKLRISIFEAIKIFKRYQVSELVL